MLDPRLVAEQPELVKTHLRRRHASDEMFAAVDAVVALAKVRSAQITERDGLLNERNVLSKEIGSLLRQKREREAEDLKIQVSMANDRVAALESSLEIVESQQNEHLKAFPNLLHADVPEGADEHANVEIYRKGTPRTFEFEPKAHIELGEKLGIIDVERAAKLSGTRFAVLKGPAARLERALFNFFLDVHVGEHDYTEVMVPYMVHRSTMEGTGQLPKFEEDLFKLSEQVNGQDMFLVPTAEVPVTNLHRDEILEEAQLPVKYACFTPCFRAEAGSAGRDVRGLIRQHQFHKVEMVWFTTPERADQDHETLVSHAEVLLQRLGLPYRKMLLCGGDIGNGAHKCFDLEVWLPSQNTYREISSCSNFADFQARRMMARYRPAEEGGKKAKTRLLYTLNGSGLAVGRTLVAILENYQQADGSVVVPEVLRPYMGGLEVIRPSTI